MKLKLLYTQSCDRTKTLCHKSMYLVLAGDACVRIEPCESSQCPYGEDIAIACVGDGTRPVEHSLDPLLHAMGGYNRIMDGSVYIPVSELINGPYLSPVAIWKLSIHYNLMKI